MRKKRLLWAAVAAALVLGCLWYSRPVDLYGLAPGLEPIQLSLSLRRYRGLDMDQRSLELKEGDPQFQEVLSRLEALRFRRSPFSLLYQLPGAQRSKNFETGDFSNNLGVADEDHYLDLQFRVDEWAAVTVLEGNGPRWRLLSLSGGEEATDALNELLWNLAAPVESES